MRPIFVCNDTMRGMINHDRVQYCRFLGEATIPRHYGMVLIESDTGHPEIVKAVTIGADPQDIKGELYDGNDFILNECQSHYGIAKRVGLTVETATGPAKAAVLLHNSSNSKPLIVAEGDYRNHAVILEQTGLHLHRRWTRGRSDPTEQMLSQRNKDQWTKDANTTPEQTAQEIEAQAMGQFRAAVEKTIGTTVGWGELEPAALKMIRLANRRMNRDHDGSAPVEDELTQAMQDIQMALGDDGPRRLTMIMRQFTNQEGAEQCPVSTVPPVAPEY